MHIPKEYQDRIKAVDRGLYATYNEKIGCIDIRHKDDRNGLDRLVLTVVDEEGNPCELNLGVLRYLANNVDWDTVGMFPDPDKMYAFFRDEQEKEKQKQKLERRGWLMDFNREHIKEWTKIYEEWKSKLTRKQVEKAVQAMNK